METFIIYSRDSINCVLNIPTPPTAPPTIAPSGGEDLEGVGAVVVGPGAGIVDDENKNDDEEEEEEELVGRVGVLFTFGSEA